MSNSKCACIAMISCFLDGNRLPLCQGSVLLCCCAPVTPHLAEAWLLRCPYFVRYKASQAGDSKSLINPCESSRLSQHCHNHHPLPRGSWRTVTTVVGLRCALGGVVCLFRLSTCSWGLVGRAVIRASSPAAMAFEWTHKQD